MQSVNEGHKGTKAFIAGAVFLVCCSYVFALNPSFDISQYAHKSWKVREGFFNGPINTIAQTPDGYLWIGSDLGLYRFDGVRSVPWQPHRNENLPSNIIRKLFVSRDGALWVGTQKGLASWKDGKLTLYPELPAEGVDAIAEDNEGTVWTGLEDIPAWRLCSIKKGAVQCFGGNGTLGLGRGAILSDRRGTLWAGTGTGLWRWKPGSAESIALSSSLSEVHALIEDDQGAVLVSTRGGIIKVTDGNIAAYRLPDYGQPFNPFPLLRDRDGGLWIGTKDRGLLHVHQGRTDHFGKSDGLSSDFVADLFEDRERNIWIGTPSGLDCFREFAVSTLPDSQGFSAASVESVLPAGDGSIWLGTRNGLDRWQDGRLTLYRKRPARLPSAVRQMIDPELPDDFQSTLFDDHRGRIWIFSRAGAAYLERGRFIQVPDLPGGFAHSIAEDSAGDLWISQDQGFFHLLQEGKVEQIPWHKLGGRGLALALAGDPSGRGLWLGFSRGDVAYFSDGQVRQWYTAAEGLGDGRVNKLQVDQDGTVWVGTEGGLSHLKNGHINTLSSQNGLPCNSVHDLVRDNAQSLWLHTGCGLVRIARSNLEAWLSDPKRTIAITVFDSYDGLTPVGTPGGLSPRMGKSADGKIWFVSGDGVSVIDPRHLPFNAIPPPVYIEQITADDKTYSATNGMRLPALVRNLAIDYTALSLITPEKVRFRYKLEGQDKGWREVTNDREVQYSNLPPRHYRFRVIAANNSGVWNQQGATLDFAIPPAWYQTNWFRAVCVAVFLALIWLAYRIRIREIEEQEEKFREAVESMPALAFVASSENQRTFVNRGWVEYTGLTVEQASGSGWQAVVHPDDLKGVLDKWRNAGTGGKPFDYELRLRCAVEEEYRWFHTRVVPLRDKRGKIVKWCGIATDIEERKRAEEKIQQHEMELRQVLDLTPLLVAVFGPDRERLYANRPSLDYIGMTLEEWQRIPDRLWFFHPDDRERMARDVYTGPDTEGPHAFEARFRKGDGTYRWFLFRDNAVCDEQGRITRWYLSATDIEHRKRAEEALQRSEAYLAEAQRLSHTGSFLWDIRTRQAVYLSDEWYRISGFDPEKEKDCAWERRSERIHPEDLPKWQAAVDKAIKEKCDYNVEERLVFPDGSVKYVHILGHPVLNTSGEAVQFMGTVTDITYRKRAEEALRESETRFRTFVDHVGDALFVYDLEQGTIADVNRTACESLGYTRQELIGSTPFVFHLEPYQAAMESAVGRAAAGETVFDTHLHRRKDGSTFPVEVHTSLVSYGGRRFLLKVARDISDRLQAEEALRRSEAYLNEAQRLTHTCSWASDGKTREVLYWSEEAFRIFGVDPKKGTLTKDQAWQRIHPEDRAKVKEASDRTFREKIEYDIEYRIVLSDGTVKNIHSLGHPVLNAQGDIVEVIGTNADITERKRAEHEREALRADLAHVNRVSVLGELAASISHELKQPITATITNANTSLRWLRREQPDLDEVRRATESIVKDGARATEIIDRLRALYKKAAPQRELVDVNEIIGEMVVLLRGEANRFAVSIRTDLAADAPKITADRVQLQQVLMNLMLNGIEAMKDTGGALMVKSHSEDDRVLISVSDTGVGLPAERANRIFDAFFTTKPQGSGMGLAISRSIVESHGGCIWATANSGRGTTFQFTLPVTMPKAEVSVNTM